MQQTPPPIPSAVPPQHRDHVKHLVGDAQELTPLLESELPVPWIDQSRPKVKQQLREASRHQKCDITTIITKPIVFLLFVGARCFRCDV